MSYQNWLFGFHVELQRGYITPIRVMNSYEQLPALWMIGWTEKLQTDFMPTTKYSCSMYFVPQNMSHFSVLFHRDIMILGGIHPFSSLIRIVELGTSHFHLIYAAFERCFSWWQARRRLAVGRWVASAWRRWNNWTVFEERGMFTLKTALSHLFFNYCW